MFLMPKSASSSRRSVIKTMIIICGFVFSLEPTLAKSKDQHDVEAIVAALQSPIPPDMLKQARDFDDQIMSQGQVEGTRVYLVTDERSRDTNAIVDRLLESMGEDPSRWVVRVLDTDVPQNNAFVVGGKYVYVFTGLIDRADSIDELAVVLGHELGHSLLQQQTRRANDSSSTFAKPITKRNRVPGKIPYYGATGILDYVEDYIFDEKLILIGEDGAKWGAGENTAFAAEGRYWVNNHAHVIRPHRDTVLDQWIIYHLNSSDLSPFITGLTVPKLNQGKLREIPIPLPPLAEQKRIVAILDKLHGETERLEAIYNQKLDDLAELKQSILQKAFRGELASVDQEGTAA